MLVDAVLPVEMRTRTLLVVGLCDCRLRYLVFLKKKRKKVFIFRLCFSSSPHKTGVRILKESRCY